MLPPPIWCSDLARNGSSMLLSLSAKSPGSRSDSIHLDSSSVRSSLNLFGEAMARPVYRNLLKALKTHVTKESGNPQFRDFVAAEFRKYKDLSDLAILQQKLRLAEDYTTLVNSIHHHKELLLSYNIGVDRRAEQSARLRDTANRVGLEMPEIYKDTNLK